MRIIVSIFLFITSVSLRAQTDDITFRRISPPGGYSFQAINTIKQDWYGYIWMGDQDGIIRYDSRNIVRYVHNPTETDGLPSNRITAIVNDALNNIWVSTDEGLCRFNRTENQFERIHYRYEDGVNPTNLINSIELDGSGNIWIIDGEYFGYLNEEENQLIRITDGLEGIPRILYNDEINRLWLGTNDGSVYLVLPEENRVTKIIESPGSMVRTIFTRNKEIWVGYDAHGARLYDLEGNLKKIYTYSSSPEFDIESSSIRKILIDTKGRIWIGAYHGLFLSSGTDLVRFNPDEYTGLPHNSIYTLYEDSQGGIWIGTWSGGVAYIHHADNSFTNYRHSNEPNSLSNNMVSSFAQMPGGELYVGTEVDGLNKFDLEKNSFQKIKVLEKEGILNIKTLLADSRGGLWIGTAFQGLYYRPKNNSRFIHYEHGIEDGNHISGERIYAFCESDSGVWIGEHSGSIDFFNFKTGKISFISSGNEAFQNIYLTIRSLYLDDSANLWIAAGNGMYQFHIPSNTLTQIKTSSFSYSKMRDTEFFFVHKLADGKIWMGSKGNAITYYDPETDQINDFDANGLLTGRDVYAIIDGQDDDLWITSNEGLVLYNKKDQRSRRFIYSDGIQGNLFNPQAIFKDSNKNIYFGGTNGFTLLKPGSINLNGKAPNVLINAVEVHNRTITPKQLGDNRFEEIVLKPEETTIKIDFSANNFLLPEKNKFTYSLDNYMTEWVEIENDGSATFVNLPAGSYIFNVRACNNDGIWNETSAQLPIVIKRFWYTSNAAIMVYVIFLVTVISFVLRTLHERTKLKKAIAIEKIERKHEDMLHEMKLKFFTNISHEFRTPLTLLNWPLKQILKSNNLTEEQRSQLGTIKRNANRMLQLINQIMDIRKVEKGELKLNLAKIDLIEFTQEKILHFSEEAKSKRIQLEFVPEKEECHIEADAEKLDKIIFNLLSNAFKFTPENGKIEVTICGSGNQNRPYFSNQLSFGKLEGDDFVEISITDNGDGIPSENLANIFDRFEQAQTKKTKTIGTGIGLNLCKDYTLLHHGIIIVQTTPGAGTSFSVRIPKKQRAQKILYESHEEVKNINAWESQKPINSSEVPDKKESILIVEDNFELLKFMIEFLENYYHVQFAKNGKQALKMLDTYQTDLIISDVMMPVMDGFEFCQRVKSQMETSHIPVILLTALSSAENMSIGLEKGADAYISKPFNEDILLSQIKNLLLQRKRVQESFTQKFLAREPMDVGNLDNYFLNRVNETIEKNIENEDFSVDFLASEMDLSRSQLHRKLKQMSNHSASEYITMVKVKKATSLLASKKYNIDEIAFKSGFNSHSYFNKCFKKIHNQSPKEYLKQL